MDDDFVRRHQSLGIVGSVWLDSLCEEVRRDRVLNPLGVLLLGGHPTRHLVMALGVEGSCGQFINRDLSLRDRVFVFEHLLEAKLVAVDTAGYLAVCRRGRRR